MVVWGGYDGSSNLRHRRAVRSGHGHLDGDLDRRGAVRASLPHGGLDGKRDGRLGRLRRLQRYLNTGGRYDPATDTWTRDLDRGGAVRALPPHGGLDGKRDGGLGRLQRHDHLNTGGRYDPATDTWTPTSTVGAPSGRRYHTAVWTGSVMVVWGG